MNIKYAIQGDIGRESAQNILAVSSQLARSLEGQTTIKTIEIDSAKAIIKVNVDTAFIIIIVSALTGVIFHPRSGSIEMLPYTEYISGPFGSMPETKYLPGVAGGWRDGKTELTTEYIYPLVDSDNASFLVSKEDDEEELLGEFLGENGNYGNLYWWNGDEEEPVFLSWKGTPTRHFRLPNNIQIPGFSTFETSSPGMLEDIPIYTAFGTKLYQDGVVLAEAPRWSWPYNPSVVGNQCLILGACQNKETGKIYIVCQADYYNAPENVFIFSDGKRLEGATSLKEEYLADNPDVSLLFEKELTKIGIYTVLFSEGGLLDGWSFVSSLQTGREGLPYFSNSNGTSFINSNGASISIDGAFARQNNPVGQYTETYTDSVCKTRFNASYNSNIFFEYKDNDLYSNQLFCSFVASTSFSTQKNTYRKFGMNWPEVVKPTDSRLFITLTKQTGTNTYNIYGGIAPFTSNVGVISGSILDISLECGIKDIEVEDACGTKVILKDQRMPLGYWTLVQTRCVRWGSVTATWLCGRTYGICSSLYHRADCSYQYPSLAVYYADDAYTGEVCKNLTTYCDAMALLCGGNWDFTVCYIKKWVCP